MGGGILFRRRFFHFLQVPNQGCACQAAPLWRRVFQGVRALGGARAGGKHPETQRFPPGAAHAAKKRRARKQTRPPFRKKRGGAGCPRPFRGCLRRHQQQTQRRKKNRAGYPTAAGTMGGHPHRAPTTSAAAGGETAISGCFPPAPTPRTAHSTPPKAFLEKAGAVFFSPPPSPGSATPQSGKM